QPDYIVVGAGAAGCIVAARLTEDPTVNVLLIEAGGSDRNPIITMPGALPFVYQRRQLQWGFRSGPEPQLGGRTIDEKMGKVLGGATSINAMIWNRGNPMDFEGGAAIGVEVGEGHRSRTITCDREVVVCAGAAKTPQLLMLSGVGDPEELRRRGIATVAEARDVGRNLQNHPGVDLQFATRRED